MFGLFKKKEAPKEPPSQQRDEWKEFAAPFLPEELSIVAVTDASGFGSVKEPEQELWRVGIGLTAWMEEDSPDIHRGEASLVSLADDTLRNYLRQRVRPDFIIKFTARVSEDGRRLLLLDLPEPGFDPDLKAILEEQKKPVSFWEDGLGTFTLNRSVGWFETEAEWLGQPARLDFDRDENRADCLTHFHTLMERQEEWDQRVRALAAEKLLDLANDWAQESEEGRETAEITQEQFMERMELDAIQIYEDGAFEFWFNDGDLFWGHSIHVTGSLTNGPEEVMDPSLSPDRLVEELSRQKCAEVAAAHPDGLVIAADTVVSVGGLVLGKPHSREEAVRMLSALSGREHMVYTGVTLFSGGRTATEHEATSVRFRPLSQGDIDHYLATGEPMDKAGAYGIQGYGSVLVEGISGDYYNVMGLPVCRLGRMLARFGVDTLSMAAKKEQGT